MPEMPDDNSGSAARSDGQPLQVQLTLFAELPGPPCGYVRHRGQDPVAFSGWLALMAELSAILDQHRGVRSTDALRSDTQPPDMGNDRP